MRYNHGHELATPGVNFNLCVVVFDGNVRKRLEKKHNLCFAKLQQCQCFVTDMQEGSGRQGGKMRTAFRLSE